MKINSRQKGKRGERQWAIALTEMGFTARRGVQYQGGTDSPDVVCEELPSVHFEVKLVNGFDIGSAIMLAAIKQAIVEGEDKKWCVVWRRHGCTRWLLTFEALTPNVIVTAEASKDILEYLNLCGGG